MGSLVFDKIRLTGFKSFVEPTDFFIESGLTGIVGPNGCGKSNLLEAIRWVMGANSAKAMRAKGMEDVIFSGTKQRPGRNQAHVTLTINNKARIAPPIFNDDDVLEVTRLITKGKGSKYQVNGKTVRAKDVQLLFADASTGANSPALVRQGQINELIAAKPENRRRILEEAAGISGLHTRRHEAELRLRAAETNLSRLDDVIGQIESQLLSLRRQSRQAARYKRLAGEIHEFRALLWLKRWTAALETLSASQQSLRQCETEVQDTAVKTAELTRIATELSELLDPKREEQLIAAAVLARLNAAKEVLEQDEHAAKSEIHKLRAQLEQLVTDITRESGIVSDANAAVARLDQEYKALSALKDTSAAIDAAQDEAKLAVTHRTDLETQYNALTRQSAEQSARRDAALRDVSQTETRLTRLQGDLIDAQNAHQALEKNNGLSDQNLFAAASKDALTALDAARARERELTQARSQAEEADQQARENLSETKQALSRLTAEHAALTRVISRGETAKWTPALSQLDVEKGYEHALAAVLGEDLDAAIDDEAPLRWTGSHTPEQKLPDGATALSNFVKAPQALAARLSQIGVVDADMLPELAEKLRPGQRLVTQNGQVIRWDGFKIASGAETSAAIKLKQQTRLGELDLDIVQAEKAVAHMQSDFESVRKARQTAEAAAREARSLIPDLERKDRAAQAALTQYETDIARAGAEKRALADRIDRLEREIKDVTGLFETAKTQSAAFADAQDFSAELARLSDTLSQARDRADEASANYRTLKNEAEARATRLTSVETERKNWTRRGAVARERVSALEERQDKVQQSLTAATDGPDKFQDRRQKLFTELATAEARRTDAADGLAVAETNLRTAESAAREAEAAHNKAREARAASDARLTAAQDRITETQARIAETLSCEPDALSGHLGDLSADSRLSEIDIERKLERLQKEREKMGGVNLRADEEAAEHEERLSAMMDERTDLEAAIARLREGIDELNTEGRERLLKAFDTVNGHFGRLFTTLFGGGEAALALTQSDDPLEAGLDVMVSPPGKALGSMSLMSGGEQALTATALIFAVFLSNPAPICVLDEVDAPLDDANVARYCNLLDEMTKSTATKFIAITHNAVTMSRMDRLFGVTMAEQGVSQLLSVELNQAERMVAAE